MNYTKEKRFIPELGREAFLYIGLPKGYKKSQQDYPVLYMHDGHNLFDAEDSYAHEIWDVVGAFKRNPTLPPCIVVALSCAMEGSLRIEEYNIFSSRLPKEKIKIPGRGRQYLAYLFEILKPEIDAKYRTKKDANHTLMMGSSMGGVISLEALCLYPERLGRIAGLSNAFYTCLSPLVRLVKKTDFTLAQKIYLDTGDQEVGLVDEEGYLKSNHRIADLLQSKTKPDQFQFRIIPGGRHHEPAWRKRLPTILKFLLQGL